MQPTPQEKLQIKTTAAPRLPVTRHVPSYIQSLVPYVPGKPIEETQREFKLKRVVKLASNENPLGPSPLALKALTRGLKELHRYPDGSGFKLKSALAQNLKVGMDSVILGNGSNEIIDFLIRTYCIAGDAIVTSQAAFVAYRLCAQIHGVKSLEAPLTSALKFDLPVLAKLARENERVKLVFVANPNNPTGTYISTDEMRGFLREISSIRGGSVLVALDYAYWEYVTAKDLPDPAKLLEEFPGQAIVLRTFSKVYGLAGVRAGYAYGAPEIISSLEKVRQPFNMNYMGLIGAEAALKDKAFVKKSVAINREGMKFWTAGLKKLGIAFWPSQGNFLLADVRPRSGGEIFQSCLKKGVIFRPVLNYGLGGALRISIGTAAENRFALKVLEEVWKVRR